MLHGSIERRKNMTKHYFKHETCESEDLGNGIKRRVLAYDENLMTVEVTFEKGAIGAMHKHPHEQMTYIISGKFEFDINGEKMIVTAGDMTYKEPDIMHGAVCLEAGQLLDIFTPSRKDFL